NTGVSASRLYWEYKGGFFNVKGVKIPVAVTVFPGEQYQAPRSWADRAYPKLIYYNTVDKGGHFAAWEQPQLFAAELRAAFRSFRSSQGVTRLAVGGPILWVSLRTNTKQRTRRSNLRSPSTHGKRLWLVLAGVGVLLVGSRSAV